ncbi:MAG: type II secretion system protein [Sulfurimonadaceae bacterium]
MKRIYFKQAFTMIELIFAIVVIAITVMSLPMMNQITSETIEDNVVQEAIFASSAELKQALTYRWDRFSAENDNNTSFSQVINISNDCNITTRKRPGHASRICLNNLAIQNSFGANFATVPSLETAVHGATSLYIDNTAASVTSAAGYKKNYFSIIAVDRNATFGLNTDPNPNPNIKRIAITVIDDNNNTVSTLESFSCNIGEAYPIKRNFI